MSKINENFTGGPAPHLSEPPLAQPHEKTSLLMARIAKGLEGEKVALGMLIYRLRRRSFGGVLLFLALLSLIPGISLLTGLITIILGGQLGLGFKAPQLASRINAMNLDTEKLKRVIEYIVPYLKRLEHYVKPRWAVLTNAPATFVIGLFVVLQALLILVPLPFTGLLPVLTICLFALGLLEKDGLLIIIASLFSFASMAIGYYVINLALQVI